MKIGIDLGTTNSALAYIDPREGEDLDFPPIRILPIPQQVASGRVEARVLRGHHHSADAGAEDGVGARRCPPVVTARLNRHVQRRPGQILASGGADRLDLGVSAAQRAVKALTNHLINPADHRADQRIRADSAAPPLSQLDRALEVRKVDLGI